MLLVLFCLGALTTSPPLSKGKRVKIPAPGRGYFCGNATELGDAGRSPGKSSLFFLTVKIPPRAERPADDPGIGLTGDRVR